MRRSYNEAELEFLNAAEIVKIMYDKGMEGVNLELYVNTLLNLLAVLIQTDIDKGLKIGEHLVYEYYKDCSTE